VLRACNRRADGRISEVAKAIAGKACRGSLDIKTLGELVEDGRVDTVLTVFPDMYGRLVGKRNTGHFFLSDVMNGGLHACDYLFACDMEMDPVHGYAYASWEKGYGVEWKGEGYG